MALMEEVASKFASCKYLEENGQGWDRQLPWVAKAGGGKNEGGRPANEGPKPPHRDPDTLATVTALGFDVKSARRALKVARDAQAAVEILLSGDFGPLAGVSDSDDEEHKARREAEEKANAEKRKAEEADEIKRVEAKADLRKNKIQQKHLLKLLTKLQKQGTWIVAAWSTFTPEDAKRVPFSKQRKYIKFYERYLLLQSGEERGSDKAQ